MLIGLMSLPDQIAYIQFHPVVYMIKLNIEMSSESTLRLRVLPRLVAYRVLSPRLCTVHLPSTETYYSLSSGLPDSETGPNQASRRRVLRVFGQHPHW